MISSRTTEKSQNELQEFSVLTEQNLDFSILDRGLGFGSQEKGAGATAAGAPRFVNTSKATVSSPVQLPAASPWIRSGAFLLDLGVLFAPWVLVFSTVLRGEVALGFSSVSRVQVVGFFGLYCFSYFLISESLGGQSIGKMLLGLRIVEDDKYEKPAGFGKALARMAIFPLSTLSLGIGLLWAFTDHKRRPWHDRATRTIVRKKAF